jgi:hypothetical protein
VSLTPGSEADLKRLERLDQWARLNGIKRVLLTVFVGKSLSDSVSKDQVQNDAELALRTRGIGVKTMVDGSVIDGFLDIDITSVASSVSAMQAVHVRVNFRVDSTPMKVNLYCSNTAPAANPQEDKVTTVLNCLDFYSVSASVWDKDELWLLGTSKLGTARESAKDLVDAFLVDVLRANEKR